MPVASPCVKICVIDEAQGHCAGCFRTLAEIAGWMTMSDETRRDVLKKAEARRARASAQVKPR